MARSRELTRAWRHDFSAHYSSRLPSISAVRRNGFRWDGKAWIDDDIDRLTIESVGEGLMTGRVRQAEAQALC